MSARFLSSTDKTSRTRIVGDVGHVVKVDRPRINVLHDVEASFEQLDEGLCSKQVSAHAHMNYSLVLKSIWVSCIDLSKSSSSGQRSLAACRRAAASSGLVSASFHIAAHAHILG